MKTILFYILSASAVSLLASCGTTSETQTPIESTPKTPVEITHMGQGSVDDALTLFGTTVYLKRNIVTAPIPAFINGVNIKLGDRVTKGDVMYILQSKESRALGNDPAKIDSTLTGFGIIKVRASASGIISTLDKQQPGDYVLEGSSLCTIAESSDLAFQVNVPFEYATYAKTGSNCTITLPDNSTFKAHFTKALTSMNVLAQTQTILATSSQNLFLPENMIVKVKVSQSKASNQQLIPKSAVQSDEMMKEYWVMKLINDSTAIKVGVRIGNRDTKNIEVVSPKFSPSDRIIRSGSYGLPDTALISIVK